MFRTGNPALNEKVFRDVRTQSPGDVMTLEGTVNKTLLSVAITFATAWWAWSSPGVIPLMIPLVIVGLVIGLVISFKRNLAPALTPVYAAAEGCILGVISAFAEARFPGVVFQAVLLTFGTLFALLMAYKSNLIRATENFKLGVVAATGAICLLYLVSFIAQLFGASMSFLHDSSALSIGISGVVVVVAALNLVLDFDFIENASQSGSAPKYMEWYGAFGLLVTLIWLYLEILHLLMKLQGGKRE